MLQDLCVFILAINEGQNKINDNDKMFSFLPESGPCSVGQSKSLCKSSDSFSKSFDPL